MSRISAHISATILTGLLMLLPIIITAFLLKFIVETTDKILAPLLTFIPVLSKHPAGASLLIILILSYFLGIVLRHALGKKLALWIRILPRRIPGISTIYSFVEQIVEVLAPIQQEEIIGRVVALELETLAGGILFGLLMNEYQVKTWGKNDILVSQESHGIVYFSSSPFPQSGQIASFPIKKIRGVKILTDGEEPKRWMTSTEYLKLIGSIGRVCPPIIEIEPLR